MTATTRMKGPALRVIEPKLMPPRVHPRVLRRARLLDVLDDAGVPLTVLNAGVGYGKTTLMRSWCTERPEAVIWLTLDSADDDPVRMWGHLATGVERLGEGFGSRALSCLAVPGAPVQTAVDELMNGLVSYGRPATIVLDDLHTIRSEASIRSVGYAIERLPANTRVVASARAEPPIGLARLRARRALTEVRGRDLAFTIQEAHDLLAREGIELSDENIELLAERTEGWPAGLYLAALWLRDLPDPDRGVREFAGSARQVGDYLTDELLSALSSEAREFLLRTSALARFTPELCDAILGRDDSAVVLADLARSNMFLVALDARGEWYRYHHLFGDVLRLELGREAVVGLRRRAAVWCHLHGLVEDAIEYAGAAGDMALVAELLLEHHREFIWGGRAGQFLGWTRRLPPEVLVEYPVLPAAGAHAAALLARPEVEIKQLLGVAERARQQSPRSWSPYVEAVVEMTRSGMLEGGEVGRAVERGRRAVAAARSGADVLKVATLAGLAHALFFAGDRDETRRIALEAVEHPDATGRPLGYIASLGLLALLDAETERVESAEAWARDALGFARQRFLADSWVTAPAHLGLALACAATDRLDEAEREAGRGEQLRRTPGPSVGHAHALLILAQVRVARSRLTRAAGDLARAHRVIGELADPGRLPALAATVERSLAAARANSSKRRPIEEPTPAELAVLRGLADGLSRREVGQQLYISLNTVKRHTRELYRKLGASSQEEVVARAEELGLLGSGQSPG